MSPYFRIAAAMALLAVVGSPALAQVASAPAATSYRSAFGGYRGLTEQPVGSWRQANDVVGRVGGWRSYAREAQGAAAPASAGAPAMPVGKGHAGHAGHTAP